MTNDRIKSHPVCSVCGRPVGPACISCGPTLHEALAAAGYGSRGADEALTRSPKMYAREVYRLADGAVIDHMRAHEAWEWLHAGCQEEAW